jgi:4-hydroxy-tetrahydrodipicolinate synthase
MADLRTALADVCTVAVTPMTADTAIDRTGAQRLAAHIARSGVGTVTVGGSVAEFLALNRAERRELVEVFVAAAADLPVVAAVAGDLESAGQGVSDAAAAGAAAIMVHQPMNPFASPDGWVTYHERIAAGTDLPVVLYLRDAGIAASHLLALTHSCPNVVAVKYAVPDPVRLAELTAALGERLTWLCGTAELWAPFAWVGGARGFTSGLANVDATLPRRLLGELRAGKATDRTTAAVAPFERLRARRGNAASVGVIKAALVGLGLLDSDAVRPPLSGLTSDERRTLDHIVAELPGAPELTARRASDTRPRSLRR